jgi:hypothetical protein
VKQSLSKAFSISQRRHVNHTDSSSASQNATQTLCKQPVRNDSKTVSYSGVIGGVLALLAYALRMVSRMPRFGGQLGWDDAVLTVAMLEVIPLSVLSVVCKNQPPSIADKHAKKLTQRQSGRSRSRAGHLDGPVREHHQDPESILLRRGPILDLSATGQDLHAAFLPQDLPAKMVPDRLLRRNGRLCRVRRRIPPGVRLPMSSDSHGMGKLARGDAWCLQRHQRTRLDFRGHQRRPRHRRLGPSPTRHREAAVEQTQEVPFLADVLRRVPRNDHQHPAPAGPGFFRRQ